MYYMENNKENETHSKTRRPLYLRELSRREASIIFRGRTRMIHVKQNYKNMYKDDICRGCGEAKESQEHVLNECTKLHEDESTKTSVEELFNNNLGKQDLKKLATKLENTETKLKNLSAVPSQSR